MSLIHRVAGTGFTVNGMVEARSFYTRVLPFQFVSEVDLIGEAWGRLIGLPGASLRVVTLRLGTERLTLTQVIGRDIPPVRHIPFDSRSNDRWFQHIAIVVSDMDAAYAHLREHEVQHVSTMPQTLPESIPAAAGIRAFYFRDPDGRNLELIWYPPGKGDPRWQAKEPLFLGIDHTAIGIHNTRHCLWFYQEQLGLRVGGESFNFGSEQERLNMVFGAHLHITGLTASGGGIGIEFLNYLAPPGGRPMPDDTRVTDLWHWETTLVADNLEAVSRAFPSAAVIDLPQPNPVGWRRALMLRDPDGHAVRIVEEAR